MKIKGFVISGIILLVVGGSLTAYAATRSDFMASKYKEEDLLTEEITKPSDEINNIKLEVNADHVLLVSEEREDIYIKNKTLGDITYTISTDEDTLSITQSEYNWWESFLTFNWFGLDIYSKEPLVIKVPNNKEFNYTIELNAGSIELNNIKANKIDIEVNAGEATLKNVISTDTKATVNAGELNFENSTFSNVDINLHAGELKFENVTSTKVKAKVTAGEMKYKGSISQEGYFEITAGDIKLNFTDKKENYTINGEGNGECIITTKKTAGNIKFTFAE